MPCTHTRANTTGRNQTGEALPPVSEDKKKIDPKIKKQEMTEEDWENDFRRDNADFSFLLFIFL